MSVALVIERIRTSVEANELAAVPTVPIAPVTTCGDLLRPWSSVYPGIDEPEEDMSRDLFFGGRGSLVRHRFTPRPRRSRRPLPIPRSIVGSPKLISPGLFHSVQGIWDWYTKKGSANTALLACRFDDAGLYKFLQALFDETAPIWPLHCSLEMIFEGDNLTELPGIRLMLPHFNYEEEGAGCVEAFLSGVDGIAWIMKSVEEQLHGLTEKDRALIATVGYTRLAQAYALYPGQKTYDIDMLENWGETFFGKVQKRFPRQMETNWPLISGDSGYDAEVTIRSSEDIEFCFAYADAYYDLMDYIPNPCEFESNDDGIAETFAKELCNVWRKTPNKPPAEKAMTPRPLTEVFQENV